MNAAEYAENASELFVLPEICTRIRELLDDEKATLDDIAELICLDPALTTKLLKLANSAFYSFPVEVDNLAKAIAIIGDNAVYNLVIADGTTKAFDKLDRKHLDIQQFWEISVDCGLIMKQLGRAIGLKSAEQLFVVGLLHNIGELVMAQARPEVISVCQRFTNQQLPSTLQRQHLGFDYAECGSALLTRWKIPDSIAIPVGQQNDPHPNKMITESQLAYLGARLALLNNFPDLFSAEQLIDEAMLDALGLQQDDIAQALSYAKMESFTILGIINPRAVTIF